MREPSNSASRLCRCRRECHEAIATYLGQDLGSPSSAACHHPPAAHGAGISLLCAWIPCLPSRSEERRVGKECRSRWSPYHEKKNGRKKDDKSREGEYV